MLHTVNNKINNYMNKHKIIIKNMLKGNVKSNKIPVVSMQENDDENIDAPS